MDPNDPQYQQLMIQALMGQNQQPQAMGAQNPSTPYGAAFMSGNMMAPPMQGQQQAPGNQMPNAMNPMQRYPSA